jgi:hypothetical protein
MFASVWSLEPLDSSSLQGGTPRTSLDTVPALLVSLQGRKNESHLSEYISENIHLNSEFTNETTSITVICWRYLRFVRMLKRVVGVHSGLMWVNGLLGGRLPSKPANPRKSVQGFGPRTWTD